MGGGANWSVSWIISKSPHFEERNGLTVHLWTSTSVVLALRDITIPSIHTVGVQSIFPLPYFSDLLVAVLVFLIAVRPRWIIDVVPVLHYVRLFLIALLTTLLPASLSLLSTIKPIYIVLISVTCPVCYRSFRRLARDGNGLFWSDCSLSRDTCRR